MHRVSKYVDEKEIISEIYRRNVSPHFSFSRQRCIRVSLLYHYKKYARARIFFYNKIKFKIFCTFSKNILRFVFNLNVKENRDTI